MLSSSEELYEVAEKVCRRHDSTCPYGLTPYAVCNCGRDQEVTAVKNALEAAERKGFMEDKAGTKRLKAEETNEMFQHYRDSLHTLSVIV